MTEDERAHYGPGERSPRSGLWAATSHEKANIALSKGDRFPPLEEPGARWVLIEPAAGELEPVEEKAADEVLADLGRVDEAAGDVDSGNVHAGGDQTAAVAGDLPSGQQDSGDPDTVAGDPTLAGLALRVVDAARDLVTGQARAGAAGSARWSHLRAAVREYDHALASVTPAEGFQIEP